jgi:HEAT repeat protein
MVRNEAAVALAKMKSARAVGPLHRLLQNKSAFVREEAAWILSEMKAGTALNPLVRALDDPESGWMAALALGKIGSQKAAQPLIDLLQSRHVKTRRAAAWALDKIPSEKAMAHLRNALKDQDEEVRFWASQALR